MCGRQRVSASWQTCQNPPCCMPEIHRKALFKCRRFAISIAPEEGRGGAWGEPAQDWGDGAVLPGGRSQAWPRWGVQPYTRSNGPQCSTCRTREDTQCVGGPVPAAGSACRGGHLVHLIIDSCRGWSSWLAGPWEQGRAVRPTGSDPPVSSVTTGLGELGAGYHRLRRCLPPQSWESEVTLLWQTLPYRTALGR